MFIFLKTLNTCVNLGAYYQLPITNYQAPNFHQRDTGLASTFLLASLSALNLRSFSVTGEGLRRCSSRILSPHSTHSVM